MGSSSHYMEIHQHRHQPIDVPHIRPHFHKRYWRVHPNGRKVANCVLVYAFKQDAIPVDTHVHRISNRLGWVKTKTPEDTEVVLEKIVPKKHWQVLNDTFVSHGKITCVPISPFCSKCPIYKQCKRVGVNRRR